MSAIDTWQKTTQSLDCLAAKGITVVGRYYSKNAWKRLEKAEAEALSAAGFTIFVVYQDGNNSYGKFSRERGLTNARTALDYAANVIGQPEHSAIYFSVDYDASPAQVNGNIRAYFKAIAEVFASNPKKYAIGVYGNGAACKKLLDDGLVQHCWLSMSTGHHGHRAFYQSRRWAICQKLETTMCGLDVDPDELNPAVDFGGFRLHQPALIGGAQDGQPLAGAGRALVKTEGLNFRKTADGDLIRALTIGEDVEVLGQAADDKWSHVRIGGQEGYVASRYLRQPENEHIERLLRNAIAQWVRFKKGAADEKVDPYCQHVGEMWQALGLDYDGRSRDEDGNEIPWSAAFISYVVRQSGLKYSDFRFAQGHAMFVHDAIQARYLERTNRPFWGYRIDEQKPGLGDIIARTRDDGDISFDYAETHTRYNSHSDIVVELREQSVRVMGGNLSDTVKLTTGAGEYALDSNGFLRPGQRCFALLKNRAAEV